MAPAFPGWLWGHKGTFLVLDSSDGTEEGTGLCTSRHQGWGRSDPGGTHGWDPPQNPTFLPLPSPLPGHDFILTPGCFPPPSVPPLPRSLLPSPQVPAVTLSWFLEPVVGFLKEPWVLPAPPSCSSKPQHSHALGPQGMEEQGMRQGDPQGHRNWEKVAKSQAMARLLRFFWGQTATGRGFPATRPSAERGVGGQSARLCLVPSAGGCTGKATARPPWRSAPGALAGQKPPKLPFPIP